MPFLSDARRLFFALAITAIVIAGLVLGRDILIPLAVATIIAFILAPVVRKLVRLRVPESAAATVVLGGTVAAILALSFVFSTQLLELAASIGSYRGNIIEKVRSVGGNGGDGMIQRASSAVDSLSAALEAELATRKPTANGEAERRIVVKTEDGLLDTVTALVGPLAKAALTLLFAVFLLLQHQDLRDRIVRIAGIERISGSTAVMSDAGARLSRLFFAQAMLNCGFGLFIAIALWIIGLPNAELWGMITAVMRFVPFIGSFVSAIPPILLAAGVDPGWGMAVATLLLFVIGEPIMGHVVEPLVLGRQAGMSPLAMVVAASFWTLIWGPIGLLLAAPLTMLLVVLGRYVPSLEIFSVLLGDEPALSVDQEFYRRVLASDALDAIQLIDEEADETSLGRASDRVVLPALIQAANDHRLGRINDDRLADLRRTMTEISTDVEEKHDAQSLDDASATTTQTGGTPSLLVVPARGPVDGLAATYVASALRAMSPWRVDCVAGSSGLTALSDSRARADASRMDAILVVTVGGVEPGHLDIILRRARASFPDARLLTLEAGAHDARSSPNSSEFSHRYFALSELAAFVGYLPASASDESSAEVERVATAAP